MLVVAGCMAAPLVGALPSAPPPLPAAADRREAERLKRAGVAALAAARRGEADPDAAAALIEAAAQRGDPDAQLLVALGRLSDAGDRRDVAAALPWLHRAAQQGQPEAQYRLAQLLEGGDGVRRDIPWAAVWFGRAAERGHPQAQFALALLRILGEGIAADPADALARLRFAERRGVAPARRYREALERRVPRAAANAAEARLRRETSRGPVHEPDRPLLRFVQSGLARQGDWPGRVDGEDGEAVRAALMTFARRERLGAADDPFAPAVLDRLRDRWPAGA
ncbi:tetratricopeptide repeat protein [Roseomonas sp. HF4]|uniref:tetratricopeptide repeat protein n=1 Tax=Roseomonas sp. HF4 TaxID=2562313 RepID=UPI0010C0F00D|nr:tetratricopeptide repeat protein [Roseomonas sp. HF4]